MADNLPVSEPNWYISLIQGTTAIPTAIAKLIETVGTQTGLFLEPTHVRRKGQAEADVTVAKAKAEAEIAVLQLENRLVIQDRQDRADERTRRREAKRQKNIEAITAQAAQLLLPESVSEESVDEDWIAQFFNHCQDVSNEQMQSLWARLLAGEVAQPGSFSLRTLAFVRTISKEDASLFTRFCSTVWQTPEGLTPIVEAGYFATLFREENLMSGVQLGYTDLARLDTLGLIRYDMTKPHRLEVPRDHGLVCSYHGHSYILLRHRESDYLITGFVALTEVGKELAGIAGSPPNEEYLSSVLSSYRRVGWEMVEIPSSEKSG